MVQKFYNKEKTNEAFSWHKAKFFPITKNNNSDFKYQAVIGIGGNVGDVRKRFTHVYRYFLNSKLLHIKQTSFILQNPPFGYINQNDFFNAVMIVQTSLSVQRLLKYFLHVERIFGRKRSFKDAPRTLDLDIIFYDTVKIMQKHIVIPHPHWHKRLSVLLPLSTILNVKYVKGNLWKIYQKRMKNL